MAREHGQLRIDIWADDDWRARSVLAQWLYEYLLSSATLNYAGVSDWRPSRIAGLASGLTPEMVRGAAAELEDHWFVVTDDETEEIGIRSFLRHDGLLKKPNVTKAMVRNFKTIVSGTIRGVIVHELRRLAEESPEWSAWSSSEVQAILSKASIDPKRRVPNQSSKGSVKGSEVDASLPTTYSLLPATDSSLPPKDESTVQPAAGRASSRSRYSKEFEEWWAVYPRKESKVAALKAFTKAIKSVELHDLITATQNYSLKMLGEEPRFVKLPAGWLNDGKWEDQEAFAPAPSARSFDCDRDGHKFISGPYCEYCGVDGRENRF